MPSRDGFTGPGSQLPLSVSLCSGGSRSAVACSREAVERYASWERWDGRCWRVAPGGTALKRSELSRENPAHNEACQNPSMTRACFFFPGWRFLLQNHDMSVGLILTGSLFARCVCSLDTSSFSSSRAAKEKELDPRHARDRVFFIKTANRAQQSRLYDFVLLG